MVHQGPSLRQFACHHIITSSFIWYQMAKVTRETRWNVKFSVASLWLVPLGSVLSLLLLGLQKASDEWGDASETVRGETKHQQSRFAPICSGLISPSFFLTLFFNLVRFTFCTLSCKLSLFYSVALSQECFINFTEMNSKWWSFSPRAPWTTGVHSPSISLSAHIHTQTQPHTSIFVRTVIDFPYPDKPNWLPFPNPNRNMKPDPNQNPILTSTF